MSSLAERTSNRRGWDLDSRFSSCETFSLDCHIICEWLFVNDCVNENLYLIDCIEYQNMVNLLVT